jgi:dipeptidyl-peptidase-4
VNWTADGSALLVQRESRDQKRLDVLRVDPATGHSTVLFSETSETWINLNDNLKPLHDGSLLWTSERSGYSHIYRFRDGHWTQLTQGDWMVRDIVGVDEARDLVYFTGNLDTPIEQHLYVVDMNHPAAPRRLTEAGWWNNVAMDNGATRALVTRSNPSQPPQVYLADTSGRRLAWIEENRVAGDHPYAPYMAAHIVPTIGSIRTEDGAELYYKLLSPPRVAGRRYPVFVQVYGGPGGGRQVERTWVNPLQEYLVQHGWVVFSIDNRGTPDRGKAFEDAIYHAMGQIEVRDQLAGLDWLKRQDFVDPDRVAVFGWSYGGYMTLRLLEGAPHGTFRAGVAVAPVTRWELYDTHYTERYLGNPATDPAPYQASDAAPHSDRIADHLLLMHGMADDNVVFENSTVLMAALQARSFPFELMVYPGATHAISGEARQLHLYRTMFDFLDRTVRNAPAEEEGATH